MPKSLLTILILLVPFLGFAQVTANSDTLVIVGSNPGNTTPQLTLSGSVKTTEGIPLPNANIKVKNNFKGTSTDNDGNYSLKFSPGKHRIVVLHIGMDTLDIEVIMVESGTLDISMTDAPMSLDEIVISGSKPSDNYEENIAGVERVEVNQVLKMPAFLGEADVVNSITLLPGVSRAGDGAAGFNVRGGRADQNLVLFNQAPVFNSSHVLGFFSIFNADVINGVTLYKGHIPARFGGRISSVLEVSDRAPNFDKFKLKASISNVSAKVAADVPLGNNKTSILVAGRVSYSDWMLRLMEDPVLQNSRAGFYDTNIGIYHNEGDHLISASFMLTGDQFEFNNEFGFDWMNSLGNLSWNFDINDRLNNDFTVTYSNYNANFLDLEGLDAGTLNNGLEYLQVKDELLIDLAEDHSISTGFEWYEYRLKPESVSPSGDDSILNDETVEKGQGRQIDFFISDDITFFDKLKTSIGFRVSNFFKIGPDEVFIYNNPLPPLADEIVDTVSYAKGETISSFHGFEPRLSITYLLKKENSIKISYNRLYQYLQQISNTTSATPTDFWVLSGNYIQPQFSDNFSLGYFHNVNYGKYEFSLEGFYRDQSNQIAYVDLPNLVLNPTIETQLVQGKGRAYGAEFMVKKNFGRMNGWLSYTYSRSEYIIDQEYSSEIETERWIPSPFDIPHQFSLLMNYRVGLKNNFSTSFVYNSGRPYTALNSAYILNGTVVPNFSERNDFRMPSYLRLDLSFTINGFIAKDKKWKDRLQLTLYNITFRRNPYSIYFRTPPNFQFPQAYKFSVLGSVFPSITYAIDI